MRLKSFFSRVENDSELMNQINLDHAGMCLWSISLEIRSDLPPNNTILPCLPLILWAQILLKCSKLLQLQA